MSTVVLTSWDMSNNQVLNLLLQVLTSDPSGVEAKIYYNSSLKQIRYFDGTTWTSLGAAGAGGPPSGAAGGDLAGSTYPNPVIAGLAVTDAKVAAANKDGVVGTPSMRTLGTGAQQAMPGNTRLDTIAAPTAAVSLNSQKIINLADPVASTDAANKNYVDITSQGFSFKNGCRLVATGPIAQTGLFTIDAVTPIAGDRILCAGQSTASQNGIWVAASGAWTRATDMDASGELKDGTLVPVTEGTTYQDSLWICTSVGTAPWIPGTNSSTWTKFTSLTDLIAGAGLTKTGNSIDFVGDANLSVAADAVSVLSAPKWTTTRTITLTGDVTSAATNIDGTANVSIATTVAGGTFPKFFAVSVGDGANGGTGGVVAPVITHSLNARDVKVEVYRNSGAYDTVYCDVERTTVNTVTLRFTVAPAANTYRCVVIGR